MEQSNEVVYIFATPALSETDEPITCRLGHKVMQTPSYREACVNLKQRISNPSSGARKSEQSTNICSALKVLLENPQSCCLLLKTFTDSNFYFFGTHNKEISILITNVFLARVGLQGALLIINNFLFLSRSP